MNVEKPSEEAVLMYVSALKQAFPDMPPPHRKKVREEGERGREKGGEGGEGREGRRRVRNQILLNTCMILN